MSNSLVDQVLSKLIEANLIRVTPGLASAEDRLELAHESLLYDWPHFQALLEKEQFSRYKRLRLTKDVEEWKSQGQPSDLLWRGVAIEEAEGYSHLSAAEMSFLNASREAALSVKLERERTSMHIENLSMRLKQMEDQNMSLKAQVRSLTFDTEQNSMYQRKYRNLWTSVMLFLALTTAAVCFIAVMRYDIDSNTQQIEKPMFDKN